MNRDWREDSLEVDQRWILSESVGMTLLGFKACGPLDWQVEDQEVTVRLSGGISRGVFTVDLDWTFPFYS